MTTIAELRKQIDELWQKAIRLGIAKGYPEFNESQPRDESGKWTEGDGVPQFASYDEANAWVDRKAREYGGKNKFSASKEFLAAYPQITRLYREAKNNYVQLGEKAMAEVGVKYGDKVSYNYGDPFMGAMEYSGVLYSRSGVPFVKLDPGQVTMSGSRFARWHKGWKKISGGAKKS